MRRRLKTEFQKHLHNSTKLSIFLLFDFPNSAFQEHSKSIEKVTKVGNGKIKNDFPFYKRICIAVINHKGGGHTDAVTFGPTNNYMRSNNFLI